MATLVARLAGPVQSWGASPTLRTATTHCTPTWSGLLGLSRAALGHLRTEPLSAVAWLLELDMAVRLDRPGRVQVDFHTINPLPSAYDRFAWLDPGDRGLVPLGTTVQTSGQAPRWLKGSAPMVTRRHLLHDASFLWLASGPDPVVQRLAEALSAPQWTLALGRKSCTPAAPLLLGTHPGTIAEVARSAPVDGLVTANTSTQLVWVRGAPDAEFTRTSAQSVLDVPLGSHPQDGHSAGRHLTVSIDAPEGDLLGWALDNLRHPARADEETPA